MELFGSGHLLLLLVGAKGGDVDVCRYCTYFVNEERKGGTEIYGGFSQFPLMSHCPYGFSQWLI